MIRRAASFVVAAVCALAAVTGMGAGGCAVSAPADLTPGLDPSIPGLDAATSDPNPAGNGGGNPGEVTTPDGGDPTDGSTDPDAGTKSLGTDSGPPADAAPPIAKPAAGEVLITEVMYTPNTPEPVSEWIELYNTASAPRMLGGLILKDGGGRTHLISQAVVVPAGGYVVLVRNKTGALAAKVPAAAIVYEYGTGLSDNAGILLANGATGGISLLDGATIIGAVPYGGWYSQSGGASLQLDVIDAAQESVKAGWCLAPTAWTTGSDKGTPGAASNCP